MAKEKPLVIRVHTDVDVNLKKLEKTIRKMSVPPIPKDLPIEFVMVSKDEDAKEIERKSMRGGVDGG